MWVSIIEELTPRTPVTQSTYAAIKAEEEDIVVLAKELERYFIPSSVGSTSSPISKHLEVVHGHLHGTLPTDPIVYTQLKKSFLRVAKSADALVAPKVKEACQHLAMKMEILAFNYKVYKEYRSSVVKNLNQLSKLRSQKDNLKDQFHIMDLKQKVKYQRQ